METEEGLCKKCRHCQVAVATCVTGYCSKCSNALRDADVARYITRKLADQLRRRGIPKPYPGVSWVRQVLKKCENKSVLSGNANARHLCVVLKDPHGGFTVDNAVLVTSAESLAIHRKRRKESSSESDEHSQEFELNFQ